MPWTRGAVHVVVAVTDHHDVRTGVDPELPQGVGDDLVLRAPARLVGGAGEDVEAVGQAEVLDDAHRGLLRLGRGQLSVVPAATRSSSMSTTPG
jgi:hypothetical protein